MQFWRELAKPRLLLPSTQGTFAMTFQIDARRSQSSQEQNIRLSPRQIEVLKWTAEGKTTWEISVIMQCAEATVNYHLRQVLRKLEAANKTHAVSRALSLGLIS